ncbi:MAG TPA: ORF6N domain-containing protein [Planctomycetota bacterium]|nr:ORF6N domain-containing protein [Planctomycetota bacterium]
MIPAERIEQAILLIRGHKVILDSDLAALYGVTTKRLNEQVRRNRERFPGDFLLQLTRTEYVRLRSQIATLKAGRGQHRKYLPYVFTEHGALMAATVINSPVAVEVSIQVVRTFVRLRQLLASHAGLARKLSALEKKYDSHFRVVFDAIRQLMAPEEPEDKRRIGFQIKGEKG